MSKAEEKALEAYPSTPNWDERITRMYRGGFIKGYHQAKKDMELTWEDIEKIVVITLRLDALAESGGMSNQEFYQEILKRFNKGRKEK